MAVFSSNSAFQINDIIFTVGPSNIQVQKENLSYRWHTLRQSSSTKIPTAHGGCVANIRIPIPREDVLKLHRLIVQFKQNPFAYIENNYLRDQIVPHWPEHQSMAFTLLNISVESVVGNVGLFLCNLQMQWFNYFPYTHNFLFREDWETDWMDTNLLTEDEQIALWIWRSEQKDNNGPTKFIKRSIFNYITNSWDTPAYSINPIESWKGFIFDLLPLPSGMMKSLPVKDPRESRIYVRYFNELQNTALINNFGIDLNSYEWLGVKDYQLGLMSGLGPDHDGNDVTLPEYCARRKIEGRIISEMLSHDSFILSFNTYKFVDLPPSIKNALGASTNEMIAALADASVATSVTSTQTGNSVVSSAGTIPIVQVSGRVTRISSSYKERLKSAEGKVSYVYDDSKLIKFPKPVVLSYKAVLGYPTIGIGHLIEPSEYDKWKDYLAYPGKRLTDQEMLDLYDNDLLIREAPLAAVIKAPITQEMFDALFSYIYNAGHFDPGVKKAISLINASDYIGASEAIRNGTATSRGKREQFLVDRRAREAKEFLSGGIPDTGAASAGTIVQTQNAVAVPPPLVVNTVPTTASTTNVVTSSSTTATSTIDTLPPWYDVLAKVSGQFTSEDSAFFQNLAKLIDAGFQYYSEDPTVNGVLWKEVFVRINGHRPFSGLTDSHNTVLTKINGTLRHIVAAIPILGHEFPTHQHLGSTDALYGFEFTTLDHKGDRSGMGGGARMLESARLTLQQNGRNIRIIYDSWMAKGDNFITRLLGTFDHYGPHDKKLIIASTQAATIEGNPGSSVMMMNCEETIAHVPESLIKVTTTSKSDYELIYKKIIKKMKEITKLATDLGVKSPAEAAKKFNQAHKPGFVNTDPYSKQFLDYLALPAGELAIGLDLATNDFFDLDVSKDSLKDFKTTFRQLDTTKVGDLTQEDIKQLSSVINRVSYDVLLGQIICMEESVGGYPQSSGDESPTTYDIWGLEEWLTPKGNRFLAFSQNKWGPATLTLMTFNPNRFGRFITSDIAEVSAYNAVNWARVNSTFAQNTSILFQPTPLTLSGRGIQPINPFDVWKEVWTSTKDLAASRTARSQDYFSQATLLDPGVEELLIRAYLMDVRSYTTNLSVFFISFTTDSDASELNRLLPENVDGSPLIHEQYGLHSSMWKSIEHRASGNFNGGNITTQEWEINKLEFIKTSIMENLRSILDSPNLIKFFDIEKEVADLHYKIITDDKDALPDLKLPAHPYWGKTYLTPPDFYYFNYHEDGAYNTEGYPLYKNLADKYVVGVHSFMEKWVKDGIRIDLTGNYTAGQVVEGNSIDIGTSADGSDGTPDAEFDALGVKRYGFTNPDPKATNLDKKDTLQFFQGNTLGKNGAIAAPLQPSNFDRDALYLPVATTDLVTRVKGIEFDFGRKEGHANERQEIARIRLDPNIPLKEQAQDTGFTHFYSGEDLKGIVEESKKDIISQKFTMKRAFPTFRLYFIEEDQTEDFLLRYDDFYHYNAIKDITVVRSRKISGDVAVIVMQNIAGILDGSKRAVIKDTDFIDDQRLPDGTLKSKGKLIEESRKSEYRETDKEEVVGSIVLRPGVNMQLRLGVGNDPNNLEVKLSGRVIDVAFSENSDLVEVTIQSFGAELEQVEKGMIPGEADTYNLTHKLLGAMMLSPELVHFGRWEVGTQFQFGESKDSKLDFKKYKGNELWGKLTTIYFSNTAEQFRDLTDIFLDRSFLAHFAGANDSSFIGTGLANLTSTLAYTWGGIQLGAAFLWDSVLAIPRVAYRTLDRRLKNEIISKKAYAMSTPQDDNLYPPHPKDYVLKPYWGWPVTKDLARNLMEGRYVAGLSTFAVEVYRGLVSQKLSIVDLTYTLDNVTIWQVFHEMTLRHPGYVYAPMPYGKEFRYTMFFGVPSQRYWSKPAHPYFVSRVNHVRQAVAPAMPDPTKDSEVRTDGNIFSETYALSDFWKIYKYRLDATNDMSKVGVSDPAVAINHSISRDRALAVSGQLEQQKELLAKLGFSPDAQGIRDALREYLISLTLRFEPFRRYHLATSETDIISNNINLSEYNVANAVACKYFTSDSKEQEDISLVKIHDRIPDEDIRLFRMPDYSNVSSKLLSLRYAVGQLVYEAKEMYSGSLLLVGNSRIKPLDVIYIIDKYNDMCGPIEVEQVVEKLSFDTGYVTEIKPNAVVFTNEISSFPILEGLKAYVSATVSEKESLYSDHKGNDFWNSIALSGFSALESLDRTSQIGFLQGKAAKDLTTFSKEEIIRLIGIPELSSSTPMQSYMTSAAWLLGGFFYINRSLDNQSIIVYPLLKNGLPMIAGIPSAQPETLWSITFGQINSFLKDVDRGTVEFISRWKLMGNAALSAFTKDGPLNQKVMTAASKTN